jgi:EpsI family protein
MSAVLVRTTRHRFLVVVLSPVIGLAMNLVRSLFLTLLANAGVSIEGRWHDLTGASILVVTTLLVAALGVALRRREKAPPEGREDALAPVPGRSPLPGLSAACLLLAAATAGVLAFAARGSGEPSARELDLGRLFPDPLPGWTAETTPHLDENSAILETRDLVERVYSTGKGPNVTYLTLYLAYWRPGEAAVSLVDAHTPDACWPGTGWEARPVPSDRETLAVGGRELAPAECRLFAHDAYQTHVWFWHLYGGRPLTYVDPHSAVRLLRLAWKYGFGQAKDQLFVRVSSNKPWEEVAAQATLRQFMENLKPLGL